ncbi:VOC family protein [Roseisalinus antarcticus]|uniref:Glyoxalase-like domain protein n=1 Tax=Roseisalinus antarcticus TaxID=254357 RepID=A0A1Y5T578_9RHOB|nr:VOC family protein [Roseisalinus antarcticus]SLN54397.1 Glyoxalase-like domain protein [Roseisalinus antarcticus]
MTRPVHFEIHGSDPAALVTFYGALFGWQFERYNDDPYWMAATGAGTGIDGAIMGRRGPAPAEDGPVMGATIVMEVDDIDAALDKGVSLGARPAADKMAVPGMGWAAYQKDPDGNVYGMFQPDEGAK